MRLVLTAAVLFQLVLRGFALPEPALAGPTDRVAQPHIHLGGHPHHHSPVHQQSSASTRLGEHRHAHPYGRAVDDHLTMPVVADEDGCPADHDADVVYLDASLVITPVTKSVHRLGDAVAVGIQPPASEPSAPARSAGGLLQLPGDSPPDFRGRFPHRLQV